MKISNEELSTWTKFVYELCGIHLDSTKAYLLENRLAQLAVDQHCSTLGALLTKARLEEELKRKVIDAITTNETSFFRDQLPFELIREHLAPEILQARAKAGRPAALRIWIAACSTGQEIWSTIMALREGSPNVAKAELYLTATDISDRVLAKAVSGQYLAMDVERGLSADRLQRYFVQEGDTWKVKPELKKCVTFRRLNLLEPFVFNPPFDIILCRNVAIYFTEADKMRLFKNMSKCLATDGALLIGSTESITGLCPEFEPARHGRSVFYRLSVGKN